MISFCCATLVQYGARTGEELPGTRSILWSSGLLGGRVFGVSSMNCDSKFCRNSNLCLSIGFASDFCSLANIKKQCTTFLYVF